MDWFRRGHRHFLEPELDDWYLTTWRWLIDNLGGAEAWRKYRTVIPTRAFFPASDAVGHERVSHVFAQVKLHCGLADWDCDLMPQPRQSDLRVGELAFLRRPGSTPAGTFGMEGNRPAITYDPDLEDEPIKMIAVLAHELAHLRLKSFPEDLPGGSDANERATDLATVVLGFGLFGANCAFNFERFQDPISQGWKSSRLGYLSEREWAFAMAARFIIIGEDPSQIQRYLKPHVYPDMIAAGKSIRTRDLLANFNSDMDRA